MNRPALSVALSVHNGERFLSGAIESVLAQTFTDFELLILDDGSTDSSAAIIAAYAARDSRIRTIHRENRGLIASLNQLLTEAHAPLIARMDADDECLPHRFERQIAFLAAHLDYGVIGATTEDIDEKGAPWHHQARACVTTHEAFLQRIADGGLLLCHPAVMYRREIVLRVGGYHAAFRHCEDLDLWLRLASVTRLCELPEPLLRYRHYPEQVSNHHATEQQIGVAIARLAWQERAAGRPDPTARLTCLPPLDALDTLFQRKGAARLVRAAVTRGILYSRSSLGNEGFEIVRRHIAEGGARNEALRQHLWRTVLRLFRFGQPLRAVRLTIALIADSLSKTCRKPSPGGSSVVNGTGTPI